MRTPTRAKSTFRLENGYASQEYVKSFPGILPLHQDWAADILRDQLFNLGLLSYEADLLNLRFATKRNLDFVPSKSAYQIQGNGLNLKIAFPWAYWETQRIKWYARAKDAVTLGIFSEMEEDNFRRICKKAGLLKGTARF